MKHSEFCAQADDTLRAAAIQSEGLAASYSDCRALWLELVHGDAKIVDLFETNERSYFVVQRKPASAAPSRLISPRDQEIFEEVVLSNAQKVVALDRAIPASTLAITVRRFLEHLGLGIIPSRLPPLLVMLVRAAKQSRPSAPLRCAEFDRDPERYRFISAPRLEHRVQALLSPAEYEVTRLLVSGHNYAQIAASRRTAVRTIANQVAAAFRRLHVSGRSELIHSLVTAAAGDEWGAASRIGAQGDHSATGS